jgi:hypothetical protein
LRNSGQAKEDKGDGREGENLLYLGNGDYFGFMGHGSKPLPLDQWRREVYAIDNIINTSLDIDH